MSQNYEKYESIRDRRNGNDINNEEFEQIRWVEIFFYSLSLKHPPASVFLVCTGLWLLLSMYFNTLTSDENIIDRRIQSRISVLRVLGTWDNSKRYFNYIFFEGIEQSMWNRYVMHNKNLHSPAHIHAWHIMAFAVVEP